MLSKLIYIFCCYVPKTAKYATDYKCYFPILYLADFPSDCMFYNANALSKHYLLDNNQICYFKD